MRRIANPRVPLLVAGLALLLPGCSSLQTFDADAYFERDLEERIGPEDAEALEIPYLINPEIDAEIQGRINPASSQKKQVDQILDIIFGQVGLQYSLTPTRNAIGTWNAREGNCLSFVHLFVGVARAKRLNPFYVEVQDYHRWSYEAGTVISRGHIVAGLYVDGSLATYDFLPYRVKAYRDFAPIDDLTAVAHHYNNLGAEALLDSDLEKASEYLELAHRVDPDFVKATNNLGVLYLRRQKLAEARDLFEGARLVEPENVPILNNLARTYQRLGDSEMIHEILAILEEVDEANPFFYLYKGNLALFEGDQAGALELMRRALRLDTEIPELHVGLAKVYLAQGELSKAKHHVERALKLDATHTEARKYAALIARGGGERPVLSSSN